ncbi:MAG: RNA pyrophosphohydrolase [Amoebophilaceae bacterium]|nr:RNA pyrophosphohydrolase [Amoebophilaceae bacterium]
MQHSAYRLGVGLMIVNSQKKIFVGKRNNLTSSLDDFLCYKAWQMPQGGVDNGEQFEAAVFREMQEEIGTNQGHIIAHTTSLLHYDFPLDIQKNAFNGACKGQRQRWFLLEFIGSEKDIILNQGSCEFIAWKWVMLNELIDLAVDFKKELYRKVVTEFAWYFK